MKTIIFLPLAEQEMNEAAIFYDTRSPGLGRAFLSAIQRETDDITQNPRAYPVQRKGIRRKLCLFSQLQ